MYVLQFALSHYVVSNVALASLRRLDSTATAAAAIQASTKLRLERAAACLVPREVVLAKSRPESIDLVGVRSSLDEIKEPFTRSRDNVTPTDLGIGVVATLRLCGFDSVEELVGPLATLALFRRVG